jgi:creatinine amidohydrolase
MWLSELKTFDLKPEVKYVFLVSLGSLEQHGPYAPLGTDTYIQDAILQKAESQLPEVVFLPTIPITRSKEHLGFLGTVSLETETLHAILQDIVNSLSVNARRIIFVSWHGGNKGVIKKFIELKQKRFPKIKLAQVTCGDEKTDRLAEELLRGPIDDHAGNTELSMMLAIRPDLIQKPKKSEEKAKIQYSWDKPIIEVTPDGVIDSHPKWVVNKQIGNRLIEIYSTNLVSKVRKLSE